MLSSTLKRSAATLGVLAGLLAAAGPASAQRQDIGVFDATARGGWPDGTLQNFNEVFALPTGPLCTTRNRWS